MIRKTIAALSLALFTTGAAHAAPIIRDAATFETYEVEGISLSTPPEEAFNRLKAAGYDTGGINRYEDWGPGGLNFVLGDYSMPTGVSSITLGRFEGRLTMISETLNRPGIDVSGVIGAAQSHFGISADEPDCRLNQAGTGGACEVRDAVEGEDITLRLTMSISSNMILRSLSRPQDLRRELQ